MLELGVSQISGGSKTSVGGYAHPEQESEEETAQFEVEDRRSLDQIVKWLMELGYVPSFVQPAIEKAEWVTDLWKYAKNNKSTISAIQMRL